MNIENVVQFRKEVNKWQVQILSRLVLIIEPVLNNLKKIQMVYLTELVTNLENKKLQFS